MSRTNLLSLIVVGVSIIPVIFMGLPARADTLPQGVSQNLALDPTYANPRNSEGDFINLKDGRILFIYTHFTTGSHDDSAAYLASRVSADGGRTWSDHDEKVIDSKVHGVANIMSVSLLRLKDDRIAFFYLIKKSALECVMVMRISVDEAKTWSEPTTCTTEPGYYVVNNGRVVQLKSGRIIAPTARHDLPKTTPGFHPGIATCVFSDDNGVTWHLSKSTLASQPGSRAGLQEPLIVELKTGLLMMLCRTDEGSQFRSYSEDGGDTWSPAVKTDILSPLSPASIKRIPSTGDLLMVWNDHSHIDPALRDKRTPLTVAISRDEGKTWEPRKTLYDDPTGWYCYTAIDFVGDHVLLGHCAGHRVAKGAGSGLSRTVVTSFEVSWLYH